MPIYHQTDVSVSRDCSLRRRDFLKCLPAAGVTAAGLSWTDHMALEAAELRRRGMACIVLWMAGGPSQFETFSPLEGHENGGETKAIATAVPGIRIAQNLPKVAGVMDELAILRSVTSKEGNHSRASFLLHTGYVPNPSVKYAALGAHAAHQIANPACELPAFCRIGGPARNGGGAGLLGVRYEPFLHRNPQQVPVNTRLTTNEARHRRRLDLLQRLETDYAAGGAAAEVGDHRQLYENASRMVLSRHMDAFDLATEPDKVRGAYGDSQFAAGCLLARRLVEAGVTFVEVAAPGWDTHADNFQRTAELSAQIDQPMTELITDLRQRGLLDRTLVVWMGEFGRTPRINGRAGRDHYPRAFTVAVAGGGVRGGQVIGQVSDDGREVAERPVTVPDLFQTFCRALGMDPDRESTTSLGRPIKVVEEGRPVEELFG